ncbi:MAG: hypothetical protein UT24_C0029G0022 [Candidatus Woesebacteria bacterium GW2011_GWB1_39_12]|uniref:Uncharacterized protein n=1 Tax=Candidatus Woesebacteria bacterium GW2011_GWB1_39_12 TaxID=1618574 RepID=A0A0G0MF89_9BACT|nr:MAG: hypothetical protein UT24_C0029G0022 [Candidatus Woesebacteria bacterium GW2011_GWB1_39_12]
MEIPKTIPPESIYNEDDEVHSLAMTEILFAQLNNTYKALEEKGKVLYESKPLPPSGDKTVNKSGTTIGGK